ncbi:MAG: hypothetical protein CVU51_07715 [Deltaproteobacteria bacterium HGW-Deltaproteobacteria-1]|nr:MAG: hypothetical protein CVU51_07715 [Deltaproteobacteria bacterium HGW-Deltaproteobacteria-1]
MIHFFFWKSFFAEQKGNRLQQAVINDDAFMEGKAVSVLGWKVSLKRFNCYALIDSKFDRGF